MSLIDIIVANYFLPLIMLIGWSSLGGSGAMDAKRLHPRPNFLFILTDDQDLLLNGLLPMEKSRHLIADQGLLFTNAFVNSPICCPSRSTILTGKYAHNTHVTNNSISGNCSSRAWQTDHESTCSVAVRLKAAANYTTFYAGKYLNQYGARAAGGLEHVPAGHDWWLGLDGNSKYYNYHLSINGTSTFFPNSYLTDHIRNATLDFLMSHHENNGGRRPFFVMLAPPAAHAPFTPAPRHVGRFPRAIAVRNPAFNYSTDDKHWLVQIAPHYLPTNSAILLDKIQRARLQTLLAVDEMIESIILRLDRLNMLDNTYILLTSDNGFHIGQFTQPWDKRQPYESDIRVPFMIRGPGIPRKQLRQYPISSVDIAPTILDLAGVSPDTFTDGNFDGQSFKHQLLLSNNNSNINDTDTSTSNKFILIEYWGESNERSVDSRCGYANDDELSECSVDNWCKCQDSRNNTYQCVVHFAKLIKFKFCQFIDDSNFVEAYNLSNDPYELTNIYGNMTQNEINYYQTVLNRMIKCKGKNCNNIDNNV